MTRENLLNLGQAGFWPLLSLTKDGTVRELVEETCEQLHAMREFKLEALTLSFASLAFQRYTEEDVSRLKWRIRSMYETMWDNPVMREILDKGYEKGIAEGMEVGMKKGMEKGLEKGRKEGIKEGLKEGELSALCEAVLTMTENRFPALVPQAQEQILKIRKAAILQKLALKIGLAATQEEAQYFLLNWRQIIVP